VAACRLFSRGSFDFWADVRLSFGQPALDRDLGEGLKSTLSSIGGRPRDFLFVTKRKTLLIMWEIDLTDLGFASPVWSTVVIAKKT
jgi:hypothetical protein